DRDAQDELIKKQLLSADLVIQLLDGRKLMTLAERENLRDWLLDRGINTVMFVVNFLNLMESDDRQQVAVRLRFLAESFRSNLPAGVSNLYQVDALPALRARLKGDMAGATQTGLPALESALQTIGQQLGQGRGPEQTLPRLKAIAKTVPPALQAQIDTLSISQPDPTDTRRVEVKKRAQMLIQQGFDQSLTKLRTWLEPDNLQANYRLGLAQALENNTTQDWLLQNLRPAWFERQKPLVSWVHQACEFFEKPCPVDVWMAFSHDQEEVNTTTKDAETGIPETDKSGRKPSMAPVAIATGLGWMLGGPLGAAVLAGTSHLVNQAGVNQPGTKQRSAQEQSSAASDQLENNNAVVDFKAQADIYLSRFSAEALGAIAAYDIEAKKVIRTKIAAPVAVNSAAREAQLNLLKTTLVELTDIVERLPTFS
ncbi:MAG: dynamin, partial [Cyanobacteria bacterium J06635_11]